MPSEQAIVFECEGESLVGILHLPDAEPKQGIFMIVGGPQYRVGSHRHFVDFARDQALHGRAVFRFDYRGMGDSTGEFLDFESVGADIQIAMDTFCEHVPTLDGVVWFGLCDAASAALMYGTDDARVNGLLLMNPWVRNERSEAQAVLKHYYLRRFFNREFWSKLISGKINPFKSAIGLLQKFRSSRKKQDTVALNFRQKMLNGAQEFSRPILLVLSGDDLTAGEFEEYVRHSGDWSTVTARDEWTWQRIPGATHTFSSKAWKRQLIEISNKWMETL